MHLLALLLLHLLAKDLLIICHLVHLLADYVPG